MRSQNDRRSSDSPERGLKRVASTESCPLTERELEVVEWIAAAKRNGEIGKILGCSSRTVQKHVQHILEKLHAETRIAICVWWYERRLDREKRKRAPRKKARG
jgi:DNA-binding CsgD family transcriptional regulator